MGHTTTKEYAELEWPINILLAVVWISYAIVFLMTIKKRTTSHIYVANWFYAAFILTIPSRFTPEQWMRWCSGGTAITRWVSS